MLTVQTVRSVQLTWQLPGGDMWQLQEVTRGRRDLVDLRAYSWTNPEVTRVTTVRVTRGTDDVSS
jgi:hypothetical protein